MNRRCRALLLAALVVLTGGCSGMAPVPPAVVGAIVGQVVGLDGVPVRDAEVTAAAETARTGSDGRFEITAPAEGVWVTVSHPSFLSRTRAGAPGDPLLVRLTPDDGQTVSLQFGGDVMMGRRFFDRDENGDRDDALIEDPASVEEHDRLLAPLAPLLGEADLTVVNVESPLVEQPYVDPTRPRPSGVHPTKEFVFASGLGMPAALANAGVDVVGLANNHQFDMLDAGVRATLDGFAAAGYPVGVRQFGLGASVDEAYRPAITEVRGLRVAFLGCTTITGVEHAINYVAGPGKAGAAPCEEARVRDEVTAAAAAADLVVFGVHGGFEYGREPSSSVRRFTEIARAAGAQLVINHHPHVVGGLDWDGRSLAAWSLGNLVFDQTVWPTFQSYVLTVHVRRGEIVRAYLEPLMVQDYVARGVGSGLADYVARTAAGLSRGPFVIEDGAVELDLTGRSAAAAREVRLPGSPTGVITALGGGWRLERADPAASQFGTDLMWVGDFDGPVVSAGPGALWTADPDARVVPDASEGGGMFQLRRGDDNTEPVVASTIHRMLLTNPGSVALRRAQGELDGEDVPPPPQPDGPRAQAQLSLVGSLRADRGARVELQISWYPGTRGPSSTQTVRVFDGAEAAHPVRVDVEAPADAVAVGVFVRLWPPTQLPGQPPAPEQVAIGLDNLRLIEWSPRGAPPTSRATHVRSFADTAVTLTATPPPGQPADPPTVPVPG